MAALSVCCGGLKSLAISAPVTTSKYSPEQRTRLRTVIKVLMVEKCVASFIVPGRRYSSYEVEAKMS